MTMFDGVQRSILAAFVLGAAPGCRELPGLEQPDSSPVANAGPDQQLEYGGQPVSVVLDGNGSRDDDGEIASYSWSSGLAAADGGMGRTGPDPENVAEPTFTLDEGVWVFTLWVTDDDGAISAPDSVTITV